VRSFHQETLEFAEAIGDLFVQNRALELRAALDVISIEAAYSGHDRVDRTLTQVAFIPPGSISQPLNEVHQIVWPGAAPVDLLALQEDEIASQMAAVVLQCVRRFLQCRQVVKYNLTGSMKSHRSSMGYSRRRPSVLAQTVLNIGVCWKGSRYLELEMLSFECFIQKRKHRQES